MQPGDDREQLKQALFRDVYFGRHGIRSELASRFAERFPTVHSALCRLERRDYRIASHRMQRLESSIFIDRICGRIMRERPDVPVLTIHDSLASTPQHLGYIRGVMTEEFGRLGVQPTFKAESFETNGTN